MPGRPGGRFGKKFYERLNDEEKQNYIAYLNGQRPHRVPRALSAEKRALVALSIIPFGTTPSAATAAAADYYRTTATAQAIGIAKAIEANLATFGIQETPAEEHQADPGFYPALAKPTLKAAGSTASPSTSAFTGKTYNKYNTRGGSIPFGRTKTASNTSDYYSQMEAITAMFNSENVTGADKMGLTFTPEYWDKVASTTVSNAASINAGVDF